MEIESRIMSLEQIGRLREPLEKLHQHHNSVSQYFSGSYPRVNFEDRVEEYKRNAKCGEYHIELLKEVETESIIGYCIAYGKKLVGKLKFFLLMKSIEEKDLVKNLYAVQWSGLHQRG